jgi:predicted transcriptional regulator
MGKKRNRLQIIHDILKVIRERDGRIKPTHILYKSNLSHQMMEEYLSELMGKKFVVEVSNGKTRTYKITDKGRNFLEKYTMIADFATSFGLGESV